MEEKGDYRTERIELVSALQKSPTFAEARFRLGLLSLRFEDGAAAESELRRALKLQYPPTELRVPLARALLLQSKFEEIENVDSIIAAASTTGPAKKSEPQQEAEFTALRGLAQLSLGDKAKAADFFKQAISLYPQSPDAMLGSALLALGSKNVPEARKLLEEALQANPKFAVGWGLLGDIERDAGNLEKADENYTHAIANHVLPGAFHLKRALTRLALGNAKGAKGDTEAAARLVPTSPTVHYVRGVIAYTEGRYADAKASFQENLKGDPKNLRSKFNLGLTSAALGEFEQAQAMLSAVVAQSPGAASPRRELARVLLRQKEGKRAREILEPLVAARPQDAEALELIGTAAMMTGDGVAGAKYLRDASALKSDSIGLQTQAGLALLAEGNIEKGFDSMASAVAKEPTQPALSAALFASYIRTGKLDQALEVAREFQKASPRNPDGYSMQAVVDRLQGRKEDARKAYEKVVELVPGDPSASHGLADLALEEGNPEAARERYEQVLQKSPEHLRTVVALANLDFKQGKEEDGVARLKAVIGRFPDVVAPQIVLAQHYLKNGELQKIEPVFASAKSSDRNSPEVLRVLGEAQFALGHMETARDLFESWVKADPASADAYFYLGLVLERMGDEKASIRSIENALKRDPAHFSARVAHFRAAESRGKHKQADEELAILKKGYAGHPELLAQEGWLAQRRNQPAEALKAFEAAFNAAPSSDSAFALARAKLSAKDQSGGLKVLMDWLERHPDDTVSLGRLAILQLSTGDPEAAKGNYEQILERDPDNLEALNNLAWLLSEQDSKKATILISRARELAPDSVGIMDTAAQVAVNSGDLRAAEALMKDAAARAPENANIRVKYAELLLKTGKTEAARRELEELEHLGKGNDASRKILDTLL